MVKSIPKKAVKAASIKPKASVEKEKDIIKAT